jgi:hypothetical protein
MDPGFDSDTDLPDLTTFQNLILERNAFEIHVYDYLVNPYMLIPDEFWEPVQVSLKIEDLTELILTDNCIICAEDCDLFRDLKCCKNKVCNECAKGWFSRSVKCPFCIQDLRNFL